MLEFDQIRQARERIASAVRHTPTERSETLSRLLGCELYIKFENLQFTAAFKERGALNKLLVMQQQKTQINGVIAASAGNHAKAVAYHAVRLGIPATLVMPLATPFGKVSDVEALGASIELHGDSLAEAAQHAAALAEQHALELIHPYDDPQVIAGQGTAAIEILEDVPDLDTLVVPIGGGGLIGGMSLAAKHLRPSIELIGVQADSYPAVSQQRQGKAVSVGGATIAEGIAVKYPGETNLALIDRFVDDVLLVSEQSLEQAVSYYINIEKTVAEGAGAASLAAVVQHPERFAGKKVCVVLSGANIDAKILAYILLRDMAYAGRLIRIAVTIDDQPGGLSQVTALVGKHDGNIIEVEHRRVFSRASARETVLEMAIEVRTEHDARNICTALESAGYAVVTH